MRILVVGGYGFIGSSIAERLIKEKHRVTVIDDLSSGLEANVQLRHTGIILDGASHRCRRVYKDENFDVVIYAARKQTIISGKSYRSQEDTVSALKNQLELSLLYKIKKFIYLSSYDVYGPLDKNVDKIISESSPVEPIDDVGKEYLYNESVCKDYRSKDLDVNILRLAHVYGPKLPYDPKNLVSIVCNYLSNGKRINYSSVDVGAQDYIHVNDVVEAIYRTINKNATPLMNVSSGYVISNDLVIHNAALFEGKNSRTKIESLKKKYSQPIYVLENKRLSEELGWQPIMKFDEGFKRTLTWFDEATDKNSNLLIETPKAKKSDLESFMPFIETLAIFAVFVAIRLFLLTSVNIDIDIMFAYIVLIAAFYGLREGVLSIGLSILFYYGLGIWRGNDIYYLIFDISTIVNMLVYAGVGVISGFAIDKERVERRHLNKDLLDAKEDLSFVENVYDKSIRIKNSLQEDIENYEDSFGKVLDITARLNRVRDEEIYNEAVQVISELMHADDVAIINVTERTHYFRVVAQLGNRFHSKSIDIYNHGYLKQVIEERIVYINRDLLENVPMLAAPIVYNDQLVAIILIDAIEFNALSLRYMNMLKVVTMLISKSIGTANLYQSAMEEKKYYFDTLIMKAPYFKEIIEMKLEAKENRLSSYLLMELDITKEEAIRNQDKLQVLIRDLDYVGELENGHIGVLFSNADHEDRYLLKQRFEDQRFVVLNIHR